MEQQESVLGIRGNDLALKEFENLFIERPVGNSCNASLREGAFDLSDDEKIRVISRHFREIMIALGLDLQNGSLCETPARVAKMFVKETFSGLNPAHKPVVTFFDNTYNYDQMLVEKNITLYSSCEHHFVPIIGKAHIGYISSGKIIGLSKLNRIVQYYSRRPQVQERLTIQIADELKNILQTDHIAVVIDATHLCVSSRGIGDTQSSTITSAYYGEFLKTTRRDEFLKYVM